MKKSEIYNRVLALLELDCDEIITAIHQLANDIEADDEGDENDEE
jgi:hypothetical protein